MSVASRAWAMRGRLGITAVVKATFRLVPDQVMEPAAPAPIVAADVPRSASPLASLRRASECAPLLRRPEIILDAVACAPSGVPVEQMKVRLAVARGAEMRLSKELRILGDRTAIPNEMPGQPLAFDRIPIMYERAFGGPGHPINPAGVGGVVEGGGRITMPNVVLGNGARVEPAGFGPIAASWPARARLRGSISVAELEDAPIAELPPDFDDRYFQVAPADQQLDDLAPGDLIVLIGMHPDLPTLRTLLPSRRAVAVAESSRGRRAKIPLRLDTLFIEPLALRAELVFRGAVEVQLEDLVGLRVAGAAEEPSVPFRFPDFAQLERGVGGTRTSADAPAMNEPPRRARDATVILDAPSPAAPRAPSPTGARIEPRPDSNHASRSGTMIIEAPPPDAARTMPMPPKPSGPAIEEIPPTPASRRGRKRREATIEMSLESAPRSLPFDKKPRRSRSSSSVAAVTPGPSWAELRTSAPGAVAPVDPGTPGAKTFIPGVSDRSEDAPPSERAPKSKRKSSSTAMRAAASEPAGAPPPPPPEVAPLPPVPEKKSREDVRWAEVPEEPRPQTSQPAARAPIPAAPDRKGQLYKKFKPK